MAANCGIIARTRSTVPIILAPGDRKTTSITAGLPFTEPAGPQILNGIHHGPEVRQADRRSIRVSYDNRTVFFSLMQLIVAFDFQGFGPIGKVSLGQAYAGGLNRGGDFIQADPVTVHRSGLQFHTDRGQRAASHEDLADPLYL